MNLYDIAVEEACLVGTTGRTREEVLRQIARQAALAPALQNVPVEEIYEKLLAREQQGSTGLGGGIAIPHARLKGAADFVFFIVTSVKGVEFHALDKKKVRVFFVLLGPEEKVREHLQVLAAVSNVIARTNVRHELLTAATGSVLHELFLAKVREQAKPRATTRSKLLVVVLYDAEFFHDILEFLLQEEVEGATILDSSGMGRYVSNIPLFASFVGFMNEQKNTSRTLLFTVPEERVETIVRGIEEITGDLDHRQGAMILALDVALSRGTMKML